MKEKSKVYLKTLGRFLLFWIGIGIILGIFFALLGLSELRVFSGAIGFIIGFLYARKKYIEEIKRIGEIK
jgi:membrane associated rhomboid family serine protease